MSARTIVNTSLYYVPKPNRWQKGIGAELPEAYKKFWREWKVQRPAPVHYVQEQGRYKRNEETGEVTPVQNVPLPLKYPKEMNDGIWGGEAIVQGYVRKFREQRVVPHFWIPSLKRSVVYSEVLDRYSTVVLTKRTINLIHEHYGFDHYLLKTPACDLRCELALRIKREILVALADKTLYPEDPVKRAEVYDKYREYLTAYTRDEIEWYGLSYKDACKKWLALNAESKKPKPLKIQYRAELISQLKDGESEKSADALATEETSVSRWMSYFNPFAKTSKTSG